MNRKLFFVILLVITLMISCKTTGFNSKSIDINGMVYDFSNRPVAHCEIYLGKWSKVISDINGRFSFPKVSPGTYLLRVEKKGFEQYSEEIIVRDQGQIIYLRLPSQKQLLDLLDEALTANDLVFAAELANRAYLIDKNSIEMLFYYATVIFKKGEYPEAANYLQIAKNLGSKDKFIDKFLEDLRRLQNADKSK